MVDRWLPAPGWVADGARVYAVGDVHGCAGRLDALHGLIAADLAARPARATLVHLGDYIDRGPDSAGTVARLAAGPPILGLPTVNLRGNHEQMLLDALTGDPAALELWAENGAAGTLAGWGASLHTPPARWPIPPRDRAFLAGLPLFRVLDGYLFVHAGVRPGVPLDAQRSDDLLWIREEFLHAAPPLLPVPLAVVHGHTPAMAPEVTATRINADTGAVRGGKLTCAVLEGRAVRFLQA